MNSFEPPTSEVSAEVLFVDLDGTLIQTDILHEALLLLSRQSLGMFLRAILKIGHGRAVFKRAVREAVNVEIRTLPFRGEVLNYVSAQRLQGRKVILATATDFKWAQNVANELGLFDGIIDLPPSNRSEVC